MPHSEEKATVSLCAELARVVLLGAELRDREQEPLLARQQRQRLQRGYEHGWAAMAAWIREWLHLLC